MRFFETSAKDDTNVSKAFHAIVKDIVERHAALPAAAPRAASGDDPAVVSGAFRSHFDGFVYVCLLALGVMIKPISDSVTTAHMLT